MSEAASPPGAPEAAAQFRETPAFTPEQLQIIAADAVAAGKMTRAEADEALKADGVTVEAHSDSTLAPEAAEIDAAFPAARPEEYAIPPVSGAHGKEMTPQERAADMRAREWLAAARFPREHGSSLAAEIGRASEQWARLSPSERQLWAIGEQRKLDALWGPSKGDKLDLARQLVRELDAKHPGLIDMLNVSGAGHSALVIAQVHAQAQRLAMRRA